MNTYVVLLLCIQICFLKNTFGQCIGSLGPGPLPNGYSTAAPYVYPNGFPDPYPGARFPDAYSGSGWPGSCEVSSYGGSGDGNVAVAGDLPVIGTTYISGQVPILGAVSFSGPVPAIGTVVISGNCACACTGSQYYNAY